MGSSNFRKQSIMLQMLCLTTGIALVISSSVTARNLYESKSATERQTISSRVTEESNVRVHRAGSFEFAIPQGGVLGAGFSGLIVDPETGEPLPNFQFPKNSWNEYLFGGSLWIGAIAGDDTLVSTGTDGWFVNHGMIPSPTLPGVRNVSGFADENFETCYNDSLDARANLRPLGVTIRQRSMAWSHDPNNDFTIIEYHITNSFNSDTLKDLYVGLFMDGDVYHPSGQSGHLDDIAGFLPKEGIAYIADNDGHSFHDRSDTLWKEQSTRAVLGVKIIDIRHSGDCKPNSPSFNWWLSNGNPNLDFGPRRAGTNEDTFRDFTDGVLGTPVSPTDKYYILSHPEQDYDQIESAIDHSADGWLPLVDSSRMVSFSDGMDARYLLSQGGISLAPGDSMVFVVAISIGENLHVNPTDFADTFDPHNPNGFYETLDFEDLERNVKVAEHLYKSDYKAEITSHPPKPTVDDTLSAEPLLSWLFSANPSVERYNVYLAKVPEGAVLCNYALIDTPQFVPENVIATVTSDTFRLTNLEDGAWYAVGVAVHTPRDSSAPVSKPIVFQYGIPQAPIWDSAMFLNDDQLEHHYVSSGNNTALQWKSQDSDIDHFNVYRVADSMLGNLYVNRKFILYSGSETCQRFSGGIFENVCSAVFRDSMYVCISSMVPQLQVPGTSLSVVDFPQTPSKHRYAVTAVDSAGNESALSTSITGYTVPTARKPLLFMAIDSVSERGNFAPRAKDMFEFYHDLLTPYDPDYLFVRTPPGGERRWPPKYSVIAQYDMVIVDGSSIRPLIGGYQEWEWSWRNWVLDYSRTGGTIVDVGIRFALNSSRERPPALVSSVFIPTRSVSYKVGWEVFGLDSILMVPFPTGQVELDSVNQFYRPIGAKATPGSGFPDLSYHHSGFYASPETITMGPIPYKGVMFPRTENTEVLYTWVSGRDSASNFEGLPVGVKYTPVTHTAYVLISNPWEWEPEQAREFFAKILGDFQTGVAEDVAPVLPEVFSLNQNFPNPFNPTTRISYYVPRRSEVTLQVYNILGQKVQTLVNRVKEIGDHVVTWDAGKFASGIYFYRLEAGETKLSRKMVLLK